MTQLQYNEETIVRLFFCGDFCSTPSTTFISVSQELKEIIASCDLKVCNFEGSVKSSGTTSSKLPPHIQQSPDVPTFLESIGFNVISFANNHAFDYGPEGYIQTINSFTKAKVYGAGSEEEVYKIQVFEVKGVKIGLFFLSYASFGSFDNSDDTIKPAFGTACIEHLCVNHLIIESRKLVDYLFVYLHDGLEYLDIPFPYQRARYKDMIDYGADGIIVHHSHTPQGWETYKDKPIFYSLGNFFFNSKETPDFISNLNYWYNGLAVVMELSERKISFQVYNTFNCKNREIKIDYSTEILRHTQNICAILKDDEQYSLQVHKETQRLWKERYVSNMLSSFLSISSSYGAIFFLKIILKAFRKKGYLQTFTYLRNINHKNLMVNAIRYKKKYL